METWTDHLGVTRPVPSPLQQRLRPSKVPLHAALRAFVFRRYGFVCLRCGEPANEPTDGYDGKQPLGTASRGCLVMDHIRNTRTQLGKNHPDNLQTLCDHCNAVKGSKMDDYRQPVGA